MVRNKNIQMTGGGYRGKHRFPLASRHSTAGRVFILVSIIYCGGLKGAPPPAVRPWSVKIYYLRVIYPCH